MTRPFSDSLSAEEFDHFLTETIEQIAAQKRRQENPYVLQLIKVLWGHGARGLRRDLVIERIYELRLTSGVKMPRKEFDKAVQSAFNRHNGQSALFKRTNRPPEDDLFYPVGGKGSGVWAVHLHKMSCG